MNTIIHRCRENPVLTTGDIIPSQDDMKVIGVFNCGGARFQGKTYLICRVAETMEPHDSRKFVVPVIGKNGHFAAETLDRTDTRFDFSDGRIVVEKKTGKTIALTSFSSLRLAVSEDGIHFSIARKSCFPPDPVSEEWGMEDPRVTKLEDKFYITYSSVSRNGVGVSLAETKDFITFRRLGMILPPTNKDTVLFPRKINGKYYLLHRPSMEGGIGDSDIWIAESIDLLHWGNHRHLCGCRTGNPWEAKKIGAGTPPVLTDKGWLLLYHGVDANERYSTGALLLDKNNPSTIVSRTVHPILEPEMSYEKSGFFSETVFPCTALEENRTLVIYYGAADNSVCRADIPLEVLLA
ncbi:MAG: glycoside hydrolase family 130 protein [Treponema sp.]|jgi:predicted GH43/DUF377 family glycosyl hydrolase|nr:glycoside hydrolase family 130 protein [Treponema sp.]